MSTPPVPKVRKRRVSQAYLNAEFNEHHWEDRLKSLRPVLYYSQPTPMETREPGGTLTIGQEYYDNGVLIALVFHYQRPDGSIGASGKRSPKMLLIGGIIHYC
jgi:hypothetical protein